MSTTAFVLFGHGARDPQWGDSMRRVATALREHAPEQRVELAFLEFIAPDLAACVEALIAEGYRRLLIVPLFIAQGGDGCFGKGCQGGEGQGRDLVGGQTLYGCACDGAELG